LLAFAPNGKLLAVANISDNIYLLDPSDGRELRQLAGRSNRVSLVELSSDGRYLAAAGQPFELHKRLGLFCCTR
jgi:WD40 repeat protein